MTATNDQARRTRMVDILSSPRLAVSVLLVLALYIGTVSWLPWTLDRLVKAPGWAVATGLDRPFSSAPFLISIFLLLVNTIACTIERTSRTGELLRGTIPHHAKVLEAKEGSACIEFLQKRGFRTESGPPYFKNRFALTKGWLFHLGLVVLIIGILLQQACHDSGSFEIGEGELVSLSAAGVVFNKDAGLLAATKIPDIQLALEQFDPYLHQEGYAPDRASTLMIRTHGDEQRVRLDRAKGVSIQGLSIYQAIPFGIALNVNIPGLGIRSLHLRQAAPRQAAGEFRDPSGGHVRMSVEAERDINDPLGTGKLSIFLVRKEEKVELTPEQPFLFGDQTAKIISLSRWAGFTYSRSPGVSMVFAGFLLVLAGTAVMLIPAGIAASGEEDLTGTLRVYVTQGADDLADDWHRFKNG
jgi:uncharacterized membrane protein